MNSRYNAISKRFMAFISVAYYVVFIIFTSVIIGFDEKFNVQFSTYAVPMIEGEIRRFLRDSSFLRVSRQIKDLSYHYLKEKAIL